MLTLLRVEPVNVDPPAFPVLAFWAAHLPLPIELAIAVPAMCALAIAMIATYFFVRERLGLSAAYLAVVFLTLTRYSDYGARPRPYAQLLAGVALTVLCWARATNATRHRKLWLAGFCLSTTFTLLTHYFSIFSVGAIVIAEISRSFKARRLDWAIWISLAISAAIFLPVYLSYAPAGQAYRPHPFEGVHLEALIATYQELTKTRQILLIITIASLVTLVFRRPRKFKNLIVEDLLLGLMLSLGPLFIYILGLSYSHTYAERYGICGILGVSLLVAGGTNFLAGGAARAILPGLVIVFILHEIHFIRLAQQPIYSAESLWPTREPPVLLENENVPIVVPDFDYAMRAHFYAPAWLSSRLIMVGSRESMLKVVGTDTPTLAMLAIHRWTGWSFEDFESFLNKNKHFFMYGEFWAYDALRSRGAIIQEVQSIGPYRLYLVDIQ